MGSVIYIPKRNIINPNAFITRWNMPSGNFTLGFRSQSTGTFNMLIDWGDGTTPTSWTTSNDPIHNYASAGIFDITITGSMPRMYLSDKTPYKTYLTDIIQWGNVGAMMWQFAFYNCINLVSLPSDSIGADISIFECFNGTFEGCTGLTNIPSTMFANVIADAADAGGSTFARCFVNCSGITSTVPDFWNYFIDSQGSDCYLGCTNAANYADIPLAWR